MVHCVQSIWRRQTVRRATKMADCYVCFMTVHTHDKHFHSVAVVRILNTQHSRTETPLETRHGQIHTNTYRCQLTEAQLETFYTVEIKQRHSMQDTGLCRHKYEYTADRWKWRQMDTTWNMKLDSYMEKGRMLASVLITSPGQDSICSSNLWPVIENTLSIC